MIFVRMMDERETPERPLSRSTQKKMIDQTAGRHETRDTRKSHERSAAIVSSPPSVRRKARQGKARPASATARPRSRCASPGYYGRLARASERAKERRKEGRKEGEAPSEGGRGLTHPDLIGARVLVHLEDRVVIMRLGGSAAAAVVIIIIGLGLLPRSRFACAHGCTTV
jgi:hypothetical protein